MITIRYNDVKLLPVYYHFAKLGSDSNNNNNNMVVEKYEIKSNLHL